MEPITVCGAVILAFGVWLEFETICMRGIKAIFSSTIMTGIKATTAVQRPLYVKYMEGVR